MSQDLQLDRAILETKERAELHAIADALQIKAGSRAKKSDIIDLILQSALGGGDRVDSVSPVSNGNSNGLNHALHEPTKYEAMETSNETPKAAGIRPPRVNLTLIKEAELEKGIAEADELTFDSDSNSKNDPVEVKLNQVNTDANSTGESETIKNASKSDNTGSDNRDSLQERDRMSENLPKEKNGKGVV